MPFLLPFTILSPFGKCTPPACLFSPSLLPSFERPTRGQRKERLDCLISPSHLRRSFSSRPPCRTLTLKCCGRFTHLLCADLQHTCTDISISFLPPNFPNIVCECVISGGCPYGDMEGLCVLRPPERGEKVSEKFHKSPSFVKTFLTRTH